ncbi:MAG: glycosyltransferase family 4 protein [Bdellovibrionales bacterium]
MKSSTLLIDAVTALGSGHLELQKELALAAARNKPSDAKVILLQSEHVEATPAHPALKVVRVPHPGRSWIKRWQWLNQDLPRLAREHQADVFYSLNGLLSHALLKQNACIGTVNNMVPFTPLLLKRRPLYHVERLRLEILKHQYVKSLKKAHAVIVHSKFALDQTKPYTGSLEEKSVLCYTGMPTNLRFDSQKPPIHPLAGRPYLFYLSAFQWYKNHENLLRAYDILRKNFDAPPLYLAGPTHDVAYAEKIKKLLQELKLGDHVRFLGALSREKIPAWIHHADIHIFASLCETNSVILAETFGVHGVLLTSNREPMPEIAGDAADYFDPENPLQMAQAIEKLLHTPGRREELRAKARERISYFSWDLCGKAIWKAAEIAMLNRAT